MNFLLPEHFGYIPETEKAKIMESTAKARYIRQSARKVRKMLDLVRGENVEKALNVLHFSPQKASKVIEGTIHSTVAMPFGTLDFPALPNYLKALTPALL